MTARPDGDAALRALVEAAPDIIAWFDASLRCRYINGAITRFTGRPPAFYLDKTLREAELPDEACRLLEDRLAEVFAGVRDVRFEYVMRGMDGRVSVHDVRLVAAAPSHALAAPCVLCVARDITEQPRVLEAADRRRREQSLAEIQERLALAQRAGHVGVFDWDVSAGVLTWTPELEQMFGFEPGTFEGTYETWAAHVHPEDRARAERRYARWVAERREEVSFEYRLLRPDGQQRWTEVRARFTYGPDGRPVRLIGTHVDIAERKQFEEALEASREIERRQLGEIEAVYDTAPIGLCVFDRDLRYVRINRRLAEIHGVAPELHIGRTLREIVPDLGEQAEAALRRVLETGQSLMDLEFTGETPARPGVVRAWVEQWVPLRNDRGDVVAISVVAEDVTDQRRREEALRESEQRFRSIFEQAAVGVARVGPDGRWLEINQRLCEIVGYTREELLGRRFQDITWHEDLDADLEQAARLLAGEIDTYAIEKRYVRRDGSLVWVNLSGSIVRSSGVPERSYFIAVVEDIDARKRAEAEQDRLMRETERAAARARLLSEATRALVSLDPETGTAERVAEVVVPAFADLCEVYLARGDDLVQVACVHADPAKQALVREWRQQFPHFHGSHPVSLVFARREPLMVADITELPANVQIASTEQAGMVAALDLSSGLVFPLLVGGRCLGVVSFWRGREESGGRYTEEDLGLGEGLAARTAVALERARLFREVQDANRLKDEFIATLSHELRTPLNAMLGWTTMLKTGTLSPDQQERALTTIERNARAQAQLLGDILDVNRIVAGKFTLDRQRVTVGSVVDRVVETMRVGAIEKGIALEVGQRDPDAQVLGDPARLQQIIWNLLSNAIKFTPHGGRVEVTESAEGGLVSIVVRDSGPGIAPAFLPHVFDRFRQADGSSARKHSGLGLGLAIVKHLVELHGGTVAADSAGEGHGATFTVRLPLAEGWREEAAGDFRPAGSVPSLAGLRLLVVDDHADSRELMGALLSNEGAEVIEAASTAEGVAAFRMAPARVALIDLSMPGEDGFACLQQLREEAARRHLALTAIAVTAHAREQDRTRAIAAGFADHIAKPVDQHVLIDAIAAAAGPTPLA